MSTVWMAKRQKTPHGCAQIAIFHQIFKKLWGFENKKEKRKKENQEEEGRKDSVSLAAENSRAPKYEFRGGRRWDIINNMKKKSVAGG